jgi:UDP-N-acetylmuramoyl-L-alanyl-D-glutamate--2,6-diaminopimelate ligase
MHNLYNILAAVSVGEVLGIDHKTIASGVERLGRVPGRLERVPGGNGVRVFVDYAHTPDALERALRTLRQVRSGRLIVVFGCGGDRDRGKRAVMGRIAALNSEVAIVTSDNPRTEDPLAIMDQIEKGIQETGRKKFKDVGFSDSWNNAGYAVIPNRREAIHLAIAKTRPGDVVLIAGKGHEDYQILGDQKIHFDDREEAACALASAGESKDL